MSQEKLSGILIRRIIRHRVELFPYILAFLVYISSIILVVSHSLWELYIPVFLILGLLVLIFRGEKLTRLPKAKVRYLQISVVIIIVWIPILESVIPALSITGFLLTFILATFAAIPWWTDHSRVTKIRVSRHIESWPELSKAVGLMGSRIQSADIHPWGWTARIALARGHIIDDVREKLPAIESHLGLHRGTAKITPTEDGLAHRVELQVVNKGAQATPVAWPGASVNTISKPVTIGLFEDGTPAEVLFLRKHALMGGIAGSGKSNALNILMGNLSACEDAIIWAVDLKKGMELQPWSSCIDRLATTSSDATELLRDGVAILEARAEMLVSNRQRIWEPAKDMPALVIVVDEYAELPPAAMTFADSIARRGRAPAVTLIAATQRPTQKTMGQMAVRSQMDIRICFRVRERGDVELIIGKGMLSAGWNADALREPGTFLISSPDHHEPRQARTYLLSDRKVSEAAAKYASQRPLLDDISSAVLESELDSGEGKTTWAAKTDIANGYRAVDRLIKALKSAGPDGISVPQLMTETKMSRPWIYLKLGELADKGHAERVKHGRWKAS